jgi:hypothetical protein
VLIVVQLVSHYDDTLKSPQPLILDPKLRFPKTARILQAWNDSASSPTDLIRQPWIICGDAVEHSRRNELEKAGARVIPIALDPQGSPLVLYLLPFSALRFSLSSLLSPVSLLIHATSSPSRTIILMAQLTWRNRSYKS